MLSNRSFRLNSPELITNNETFHRLLTEGITVSYQKGGYDRGDLVWLIDFENPENNEFIIANQFTVTANNVNKRPDIVIFINGIPLVVIELKNVTDENATIKSAFKQVQTYKEAISVLISKGTITSNCTAWCKERQSRYYIHYAAHCGIVRTVLMNEKQKKGNIRKIQEK
jgi:type I site-specific restriction-modification system R (restriction) subunit